MSLHFLLIFFVARYLRKTLSNEPGYNYWEEKLKSVMIISIVAFGATFAFQKSSITAWVSDVVLLFCVYILYTRPFFKPAKSILLAVAPYAIVSIISDTIKLVAPGFHESQNEIFDGIELFSVLWGGGVWVVTSRQRKELNKAKQEVEAQEQNNRLITAMKAELEVQVAERTAELTKQKEALEATVSELKSTQAQLIQSEKMASLGELTAGIAHEIQNPLNFVNNFSEINSELIEELRVERLKPEEKRDPQLENDILNDIKANEEKINHHGKRADAIVKGMLQHSRTNTGQKELTDINALCDEYIRLSYHGLRAKDKSFNAKFETAFDGTIDKVNIVPQDMGRVLLNLFNNAFYAANEKKKQLDENPTNEQQYQPTVWVKTKRLNNKIEIVVTDNGNGIPESIIDKIFQPFFTTKPTGQGTGLGLSLTYDIIKAHGGEIDVKTKEGEGTAFIILLPA